MVIGTTPPTVTGHEPRIAIVSTSINPAPAAYKAWAQQGDLIVAGDQNSPSELVEFLSVIGGLYLSPENQDKHCPGSEHIGWKNIQRRNAATWWALTATPTYDYIVTVDDDNFPVDDNWVWGHIGNMGLHHGHSLGSKSGFLNTGNLCIPQFHQRGVPYGVNTDPVVQSVLMTPRIVVSQAQVIGDPDCDAVERIANAPNIVAVAMDAVITPGMYAAFNTQATVWSRDWAPLLAVMPGIGRYDDIFGSYIFHRLAREYKVALHVGTPCVTQYRNEHDLAKDLRAELWGMHRVFEFVEALDRAHISSDMPLVEAYGELITAVAHILPSEAVKFAQAWARAWREQL
jgi:hypothetical protein